MYVHIPTLGAVLALAAVTLGCGSDDSSPARASGGGGAGAIGGSGASGGAGGSAASGGSSGSAGATEHYDVVVVGAGPGGIAASIRAARMGASVLLVEETDWVGGQASAAAVSNMDGGSQEPVHSGLYKELVDRVRAYYQDNFDPDKAVSTCYPGAGAQAVCFEPHVGNLVFQKMLADAGVEVRTKTHAVSLDLDANAVRGLKLSSGADIVASVTIDATERGDLLPLAGARYRIGNATSDAPNPNACMQSLTYVGTLRRYTAGVPKELVIQAPPPNYAENLPPYQHVVSATGTPTAYPFTFAVHNGYRGVPDSSSPGSYTNQELAAITKTNINWANDHPTPYVATGDTAEKLPAKYLEDATFRHQTDCAAKLRTLGFVYYVQTELGQPDWSIANDEGTDTPYNVGDNDCAEIPTELKPLEHRLALMPYVRESRRVVSVTTLTAKDLKPAPTLPYHTQGFVDAIATGDYGTDLHNCHDDADFDLGEISTDGSQGTRIFEVPIGSLIPESVDGLLAAEKNIGVSRLAQGAIRLQPAVMGTGEAAGALAALSVELGKPPRDVPAIRVQAALVDAGHAVSRFAYSDVPLDHPAWSDVELVSVHGLMLGTTIGGTAPAANVFSIANPVTRAQAAVVLAKLFALDLSNPPATPTFQDVPVGAFGYAEIEAVAAAGITAGCSAAPVNFCPNNPVTRAQLAAFLVRGLGLDLATAPTAPLFDDVPASDPFFKAIQLAAQQKLIDGCTATTFCASENALRSLLAHGAAAVLRR